ncbi:hypothetical protein MNAN1_000414 [Malassezia nana]|uniref:Uncharacterized protein n=1 Tax=Malassezia nana TaxID=180528 RepID=A0AAF0EIJ0_9BASI|nr:hypothetical protein MNAN1_000414 [Malassezia nana]
MTEAAAQGAPRTTPGSLHGGNARPLHVKPVFDMQSSPETEPPEVVYTDREGARLPLHSPYAERDWTAWKSMTRASAHRMDHPDAPLRSHADQTPSTAPQHTEQHEAQDMVGWAITSLSPTSAQPANEREAPLTLHYTHSRPWDQPWSFGDALEGQKGIHDALGPKAAPMSLGKRTMVLFFLRNPFVPLLLRLINIMLISCSLAVSARLHISLQRNGDLHAVGVSPLTGIIFAPPSIVHSLFQIWLEYRSRPIGLWQASSKLWYMMLELVFVCLWSAELGLVFDNYFTSMLVCVNAPTPFYHHAV